MRPLIFLFCGELTAAFGIVQITTNFSIH